MTTVEEIREFIKSGETGKAVAMNAIWEEVMEGRSSDDPDIPILCALRAQLHYEVHEWGDAKEWAERAEDNPEALRILANLRILVQTAENLGRGRATATGIGVFAAFIKMEEKIEGFPRRSQVLLRRRLEQDSLYGQDLSGKWEMTGGGVELDHFGEPYQVAIVAALLQELQEEAGLKMAAALPRHFFLIPAWIYNSVRGVLDLAFVVPIPWRYATETDEFRQKLESGEVRFFYSEELGKIEIVSPRTRNLINQALEYAEHYW